MLVAVFMALKQGYAMLTGKPEMVEMFGKWHFNKTEFIINGVQSQLLEHCLYLT